MAGWVDRRGMEHRVRLGREKFTEWLTLLYASDCASHSCSIVFPLTAACRRTLCSGDTRSFEVRWNDREEDNRERMYRVSLRCDGPGDDWRGCEVNNLGKCWGFCFLIRWLKPGCMAGHLRVTVDWNKWPKMRFSPVELPCITWLSTRGKKSCRGTYVSRCIEGADTDALWVLCDCCIDVCDMVLCCCHQPQVNFNAQQMAATFWNTQMPWNGVEMKTWGIRATIAFCRMFSTRSEWLLFFEEWDEFIFSTLTGATWASAHSPRMLNECKLL